MQEPNEVKEEITDSQLTQNFEKFLEEIAETNRNETQEWLMCYTPPQTPQPPARDDSPKGLDAPSVNSEQLYAGAANVLHPTNLKECRECKNSWRHKKIIR